MPCPIALYFTVFGTATQRAQTTSPVCNSTAASTVCASGTGVSGQHVLGASPVPLGQNLASAVMGSMASVSQAGVPQVARPTLAPSHALQPNVLSQRLVLTSQAQARLPSKWPPLHPFEHLPSASAQQYGLL